jgi:type II secretory pathway pseudopilin PulG
MLARRRPGPNDEGETLIEVIMAVAIMGIAVVAIVGGIATTIVMSDVHRDETTAGAYVRNYAEAVETYVAVPGNFNATASASTLQTAVGLAGFAAPTGFTAAVTSVKCWNSTVFGPCAAGNTVQQVTLNMASVDFRASESLAVVVRKP